MTDLQEQHVQAPLDVLTKGLEGLGYQVEVRQNFSVPALEIDEHTPERLLEALGTAAHSLNNGGRWDLGTGPSAFSWDDTAQRLRKNYLLLRFGEISEKKAADLLSLTAALLRSD